MFLVHGMARTPVSMTLLGRRLARAGFQVDYFGYSVTFERLEHIAKRFSQKARALIGDSGDSYAVVGHSLGNIITRLASPTLPPGFTRFAMLAPPNQSSTLARRLRDNPVFRLVTRDAGQSLGDDDFYASLPIPELPILVVAGNAGPRDSRLPLGDAANDGVVRVDETQLGDVPTVEVPALHTFLMNRRDVANTVVEFLTSGDVPQADAGNSG